MRRNTTRCRLLTLTASLLWLLQFMTLSYGASVPLESQSRPIVFAAKMFDGQTQGHFHLYGINPDGSGQIQITNGLTDDVNPVWSPDGKWIVFERASDSYTVDCALSVLNVSTGKVTKLCTAIWQEHNPNYFWQSQPFGLVVPGDDDHDTVEFALKNGVFHALPMDLPYVENADGTWREYSDYDHLLTVEKKIGATWQQDRSVKTDPESNICTAWIDNNTLAWYGQMHQEEASGVYIATLSSNKALADSYVEVNVANRVGWLPNHSSQADYSSQANSITGWGGHPHDVILEFNSFVDDDESAIDLVDAPLNDQPIKVLCTSVDSFTQSPDGSQFAIAPVGANFKSFFASPLYIVDTSSGKRTMITPPTSRVYSVDWRQSN